MRRTRFGDFTRPLSIAEINPRNRDFHAARAAADPVRRTGDGRPSTEAARQTALRDALHAQSQAATPADVLRAMNHAHRAF